MRAWKLIKPTKDSTSTHGEIYSAIELPEIPDEWAHMPAWLNDVGECVHNGSFYQPLPFTEIESWARQTGLELTHFEVRALRQMSNNFSSMMNRSEQQEPCPIELPEDGMLQSEADMMAAVASCLRLGWFLMSSSMALPRLEAVSPRGSELRRRRMAGR